jgi:hypothetical protein
MNLNEKKSESSGTLPRRIATMQPTYLPWLGYFDMISKVDCFVFLDNVQFEKRSWQSRNKIKSPDGELLLSVPVNTKSKFNQEIKDVELVEPQIFRSQHLKSIERFYAKSEYFSEVFPILEKVFVLKTNKLVSLNVDLIISIAEYLELNTEFFLGSELSAKGSKTNLTVAQCVELGGTKFLAAQGSRDYVSLENGFEDSGIQVEFHEFAYPFYPQQFGKFISHLSVVDVLFNCGKHSKDFFKQQCK